MDLYKKLKEFGKVKLKEPLSKHTTFKIGGPADFFVIVGSTEELVGLLNFLIGEGIEYFLIGGGSNMLVSDDGFDGVVISTTNSKQLTIDNDLIEAEAGAAIAEISQFSMKNNLTGFEWAIGVPGTIGGAVRGNAGALGSCMKDMVQKVIVYKDGEVVELSKDDCEFGYRNSIFKHNRDIILKVYLKLEQGELRSKRGYPGVKSESNDLVKKAMENIEYRKKTQPQEYSSGCIFKNSRLPVPEATANGGQVKLDDKTKGDFPKEFIDRGVVPAWWLVKEVGMEGVIEGNAKVSEKHSNFIVNTGGAKARDVLLLIEQVKEKVYDRFGIELEEEIQLINF